MNAREKASELIVNYQLQCKSLDYQQAKQCALICVDEILKTNPITYGTDINGEFYIDSITIKSYWQEVKNEIEKL